MRVRLLACAACLLAVTGLAIFFNDGNHANARFQDASATGTPEASPTGNIVTLVAWYAQDPSGEFLTVGPLRTNNNLVASTGDVTDRTLTGEVDFDSPDNNELPRITLGESIFDAYPLNEDDPDTTFRWLYLNDDPGLRPATLVLQIRATAGPYEGMEGSATFISRATDAGGVLVIVVNSPAE